MVFTQEINIYSPDATILEDGDFFGDTEEEDVGIEEGRETDLLRAILNNQSERSLDAMYSDTQGSFDYSVVRGQNLQRYTFNTPTRESAILTSKILLEPDTIDRSRLPQSYVRGFDIVKDSGGGANLFEIYAANEGPEILRDLITNTGSIGDEVFNNSVVNPNSGRLIGISGRTFREVFGKINLKDDEPRKILSNIYCENYNIKSYCVPSYVNSISKKIGKKKTKYILEELKNNKTPTYLELTEIFNKYNMGIITYIIDKDIISEKRQDEYKKKFKILIHDNHLYKIKKLNMKNKTEIVSQDKFEDLIEENNKYFEIQGCDQNELIIYDKRYSLEKDNTMMFINDEFQYMNKYSRVNTDFYRNCGIRAVQYFDEKEKWGSNIDIVRCYENIMRSKNPLPLNTGTEYVREYKSQKIRDYCFYLCKLKNLDEIQKIIFGEKGKQVWIMGYLIKKHKIDVKIKYEYFVKSFRIYGKVERICRNECDKWKCDCDDIKFKKNEIQIFTGTLGRSETTEEISYTINDNYEMKAMKMKYGKKCYNRINELNIIKKNYKINSGMLTYIGIFSYCHSQLMDIYYAAKSIDNKIKIKKIRTDCISFNKKINKKKLQRILDFKIQIEKKYKIASISKFSNNFDHKKYIKKNINNLNKKNYMKKIKEGESLFITGPAGVGKSYTVKNNILKYFDDNKIKYITTSSTKCNAKDWDNKYTISHYIRKSLGLVDMLKNLKNVKYIIIDECTQMTMNIYNNLQYLKSNGINFIFMGDKHQCKSVDGISYIGTQIFDELIDYNYYEIQYHKYARYTKEYYDFVQMFPKLNINKLKKHIIKNIKKATKEEIMNNINICYTNRYGKRIEKATNKKYHTIHSYQGKTIKDKYIVHQINTINDYRILYTAFTRATGFENVRYFFKRT